MNDFSELIVRVHQVFKTTEIPHAFSGALALAWVAEPRGTVDIDVNTFVPLNDIARVSGALATLGFEAEPGTGEPPIAGHRFRSVDSIFPIDVFCNLDERYASIEARIEHHDFGDPPVPLPFVSGEDLCVFKLSLGRPIDWADVENIARANPALDIDYIEEMLVGLRGPSMYQRLARFRRLLR